MDDEQKEVEIVGLTSELIAFSEAVARLHCELLKLGIPPDEVVDLIAEAYVRVAAGKIDDHIVKILRSQRDTNGKTNGSTSVEGVTGQLTIDVARGFLRALDRHLKEIDRNPR